MQIILSALAAESDTNGANPEQKKENKSSHTFCYSDALFVIEYDDFLSLLLHNQGKAHQHKFSYLLFIYKFNYYRIILQIIE